MHVPFTVLTRENPSNSQREFMQTYLDTAGRLHTQVSRLFPPLFRQQMMFNLDRCPRSNVRFDYRKKGIISMYDMNPCYLVANNHVLVQ